MAHDMHGTTILSVRRGNMVAIGGDGQVSLGQTIVKGDARKVRQIGDGKVIVGFAGGTAGAFTLLEPLESKLEPYSGRLEAMLIVADATTTLTLTGAGDVIEPEFGVAAIGSGGEYARAAARALIEETELDAEAIVSKSMAIAASVCVYTNSSLTLEKIVS